MANSLQPCLRPKTIWLDVAAEPLLAMALVSEDSSAAYLKNAIALYELIPNTDLVGLDKVIVEEDSFLI
jgi:hypothetical protein